MIHLTWMLINLCLFFYFIFNAFRAVNLVAQKYGLAATLVLIVGILGILNGRSGSANKNQVNAHLQYVFNNRDSLITSNFTSVKVKDNLISEIKLIVLAGKNKTTGKPAVAEAKAVLTGIYGGYWWESNYVDIVPVAGTGQFRYFIDGTKSWNLLGVEFNTYSTHYEGTFTPNLNR